MSPGPLTGGCERHHYAEIGVLWPYGENLTLEYANDTIATYKVSHQPGGSLLDVFDPKLHDTPHRSPQPHLWELGEAEWLKVVRMPEYVPSRRRRAIGVQEALLTSQETG
ncbi:MAG: hypothetical protein M3P51_03930 [Chloroflexota bacterium]|nr:hypothetical protein [Chloroflexota bacterium]